MSNMPFDRLHCVESLRNAGITDEHARAHAYALDEALRETIATKHDVRESRIEIMQYITEVRTELKQEIADVKSELKQEIADVKSELKADIAAVRAELKQEIADVKSELKADIAELRVEVKSLRSDMDIMKRDLMIFMGVLVIGLGGFLTSIQFFMR